MDSYELRKERAHNFYAVVLALIVTALDRLDPTGWKVEGKEENENHWCRAVVNAKGERFSVQFDADKNKLTIHSSYGQRLNGQVWIARDGTLRNQVADPQPTVSAEKAPEQIARDIVRRFLPDYRTIRADYLASITKATAYRDKRDRFFDELCKLSGGRIKPRDSRYQPDAPDGERTANLYGISGIAYGEMRVSDNSARFEISVTAEFARKLAKIIATMPETKPEDE